MARLTYNAISGHLIVHPENPAHGPPLVAFAYSSDHRSYWLQKQKGGHGKPGHVHGGPIPPGTWKVHRPGSRHPDGGILRPQWIPIGPIKGGRTLLYIHPAGTLSEGCIAVLDRTLYQKIFDLLELENGGVIHVHTGGESPA